MDPFIGGILMLAIPIVLIILLCWRIMVMVRRDVRRAEDLIWNTILKPVVGDSHTALYAHPMCKVCLTVGPYIAEYDGKIEAKRSVFLDELELHGPFKWFTKDLVAIMERAAHCNHLIEVIVVNAQHNRRMEAALLHGYHAFDDGHKYMRELR